MGILFRITLDPGLHVDEDRAIGIEIDRPADLELNDAETATRLDPAPGTPAKESEYDGDAIRGPEASDPPGLVCEELGPFG